MKNNSLLTAVVGLAIGLGAGYVVAKKMGSMSAMKTGNAQFDLQLALNKLWSDHVIWTRDYIIAAVADAPDAQAAATRLLKNQEDLGNAIAPFYGADAGKKLTALLKDHILIAVDVVKAAKADDKAALKESDARWHANAVDIATFLSSANPNWTKQDLTNMLNEHLTLTTQEAVARISKEWDKDVTTFDKIFEQALMMAKTFADGIVKQFPEKF